MDALSGQMSSNSDCQGPWPKAAELRWDPGPLRLTSTGLKAWPARVQLHAQQALRDGRLEGVAAIRSCL